MAVLLQRFVEDHRAGDEWLVLDNTQENDIFFRGGASGDCRRDITNKLELLGIGRPVHALCNSHTN
jgi:hypothetical protein